MLIITIILLLKYSIQYNTNAMHELLLLKETTAHEIHNIVREHGDRGVNYLSLTKCENFYVYKSQVVENRLSCEHYTYKFY